ncbi:hypothetical protein HPP92_005981 [Vanilla planifolia]|uniref:Uncharacterized protein n=1 Tax=Vanilla planifolia TaxID=51239 RepID=A0A835S0L9_VANPL|nr:hypothetical protein HPP92_005981 [Vanilla planifolia]
MEVQYPVILKQREAPMCHGGQAIVERESGSFLQSKEEEVWAAIDATFERVAEQKKTATCLRRRKDHDDGASLTKSLKYMICKR